MTHHRPSPGEAPSLTDTQARRDLLNGRHGCQDDRWYAERWNWRDHHGRLDIEGVIRLRLGGARDATLPVMYDRHIDRLAGRQPRKASRGRR